MKKFKNIALLGATALVGVVGFSACSSDDDPTSNTIEATGETVKTAFTLSIPNQAQTRMATDEAGENQSSTKFDGIQDIYMFPVATGSMTTDIDANSTLSLNAIHLANWTANTFDVNKLQAKVYTDVAIPVGVNHFLFYGRRIAGTNNNGELNFDFSTITTSSTPKDINFELVPIYEKTISEETSAKAIIEAMNDIDAALTTAAKTANDISGYATNWQTMEAGSATTVAAAVSDLYASMKTLKGNVTGTTTVYDNVMSTIKKYFTVDENNYSSNGTVVATWTTANTFPRDINLPDGAVSVTYTSGTGFAYAGVGAVPTGVTSDYIAADKYVKPAELFYYVNSPVGTADKIILGDSNITLPTTWDGLFTTGQTYSYDKKAVSVNTKSVILEDQIQYAVGRLELAVKVADVAGGILDHGNADGTIQPTVVSIPTNGYPLTGVLVGGQKNVGWDFTPNGTDEWTIYDGTIPDGITANKQTSTTTYSSPNSTLVLETAANAKVRVCLEFENNGLDFYGHDGELIPAGTKFYLVAELDPANGTQPTTSTAFNQVFMQDYVTKVNLTIGQNSLKNAYQTIPDLRSPKLELGLSVNLKWQNGLTFEQEF